MKKTVQYPFRITAFHSSFDFKWDKTFSFAGERHGFWEIVAVCSGKVEITEDEKIYVLSAGDMICHAPTEFHRIRSYGDTEPHVLVVSFEHEGVLPEKLSDGPFTLSPNELAEYSLIFKRLYEWFNGETDSSEGYGAAIGFALSDFILRLSSAHTPFKAVNVSGRAREYQQIVKIMQSTVYDNLSLSDIAKRAAVSVSTVKSLFFTFLGISPIKYYSLIQIDEAKKLLSEGASVCEISEKMNFSSPNYFCSFFKRIVGCTPSKYKKAE